MDIKFKNISIINFLSLHEVEIQLESKGFVIVKGVNNESAMTLSNGAGKSSIFDAIFWTITGETLRGTSEVVNEFYKKEGCNCKLDLIVNNIEYTIHRFKGDPTKGNTCLVYENGTLISDQTKKSQDVINNTISIAVSSDILGSIILLGQGLPYRFSNLSPIKRKDLLEIMSGSSNKIDKLKSQLETKTANYQADLSKHTQEVNKLSGENIGLNSSKLQIENQIKEKESKDEIENKIKELFKNNEDYDTLINNSRDTIAALNTELNNFISVRDNLRSYISQQEGSKTTLRNNLNSIKSGVCPTCGRPYEVTEESIRDKERLTNEIANIDNIISQLNIKLSGISEQVNSKTTEVNNLQNQINSYILTKNNNTSEITRLEGLLKDNESWEGKIKEIETQITDNNIKINDISKEIETINDYLTNLDYLKRITSRDFKGYMLEEVINYVSLRSAYYGKYLFSGKDISVVLDSNKILINLGDRLYENLSGGERQRVDLCVQFALRDMLSVVTGFSCNIIVLDEAFDNLDSKGSEDLINLVTNELSDIESIYIVTHHTDISIPYDETITITKDSNGVSKIV